MEERFNFNLILNSLLMLIPVNLFILAVMTVYRAAFFMLFADFSTAQAFKAYIFKAFLMGFRFDLSVVAYVNAPITLLFFISMLLQSDFVFKAIVGIHRLGRATVLPDNALCKTARSGQLNI